MDPWGPKGAPTRLGSHISLPLASSPVSIALSWLTIPGNHGIPWKGEVLSAPGHVLCIYIYMYSIEIYWYVDSLYIYMCVCVLYCVYIYISLPESGHIHVYKDYKDIYFIYHCGDIYFIYLMYCKFRPCSIKKIQRFTPPCGRSFHNLSMDSRQIRENRCLAPDSVPGNIHRKTIGKP